MKNPDWSRYGSCRCGAPAGTACLDLRMGRNGLASVTRPHKGRRPWRHGEPPGCGKWNCVICNAAGSTTRDLTGSGCCRYPQQETP